MLGKLVAVSILQGGPGFPVMLPAAYSYICKEDYVSKLADADVPDPLVATLLDQVSYNYIRIGVAIDVTV